MNAIRVYKGLFQHACVIIGLLVILYPIETTIFMKNRINNWFECIHEENEWLPNKDAVRKNGWTQGDNCVQKVTTKLVYGRQRLIQCPDHNDLEDSWKIFGSLNIAIKKYS